MHSMGAYNSQEPRTIMIFGKDPVNGSAKHSALLRNSAIAGSILAWSEQLYMVPYGTGADLASHMCDSTA